MRNRITTVLSVGLMAIGMLAAAPASAQAQNVWVFNQMESTDLKPCFRVGSQSGWVDFGGIGALGQFAWGDFLEGIAKPILGGDSDATEVLVRFTWVAIGSGGCPAPNQEPNGKTVFTVDGRTPVYILVGGKEEVRRVEGNKQ